MELASNGRSVGWGQRIHPSLQVHTELFESWDIVVQSSPWPRTRCCMYMWYSDRISMTATGTYVTIAVYWCVRKNENGVLWHLLKMGCSEEIVQWIAELLPAYSRKNCWALASTGMGQVHTCTNSTLQSSWGSCHYCPCIAQGLKNECLKMAVKHEQGRKIQDSNGRGGAL